MFPHGRGGKKIAFSIFTLGKEIKWEKVTDKAGLARKLKR